MHSLSIQKEHEVKAGAGGGELTSNLLNLRKFLLNRYNF